jgi:agmatine deiminase
MAWAVHPEWKDWVQEVEAELAEVIRTISQFEPVRLLTPPADVAEARARFPSSRVDIVEATVDDIWMRDIAPTFALRGDEVVAIDWNFNGWGGSRERPPRKGDRLAEMSPSVFGVPRIEATFVAEGGALITDGEGTVIATRSCLLNPNRNPVRAGENRQHAIERALDAFGIRRVVWLEGDPCEPITSGHVDGYVMFTAPGAVLVETVEDEQTEPPLWREHDIAILGEVLDAAGRMIKVERVRAPRKQYWKFRGPFWAPCYLNAYVANGAMIAGRFGDAERDEAAKNALKTAFPDRKIVMLRIDHIASGGGGIPCLTQPMPGAKRRNGNE